MYSVIRNARRLSLPIDIQLQLFDNMVTPILLYGCEVWGKEDCEIIEKLHLQFCRILLRVNKFTSRQMIHGDLGRYSIETIVKQRICCYRAKLLHTNESKICRIMYKLLYLLDKKSNFESPWLKKVKIF